MIVSLPVCYTAEVRNASGQGWVRRNLLHTVQADIQEVSPKDCEVSAENLDFGTGSFMTSLWRDGGNWIRETSNTYGGGRTFREVFDPGDARQVAIMVLGHRWRAHQREGEGHDERASLRLVNQWLEQGMTADGKYEEREKRDSTLRREMLRFGGYLRDMMVVDGYLYRRIPAPFFRIQNDGRHCRARLVEGGKAGPWGAFALDRYDDLIAHLSRNFPAGFTIECERPGVRMPKAFAWSAEEASLDGAVEFALDFARTHKGWGVDRDLANAALWKAVEESCRDGGVDRDRLAEGLGEFGAINQRRNELSRSGVFEAWHVAHAANAAADRWRQASLVPEAGPDGECPPAFSM